MGKVIPPGTCAHIGDKLLQMSATNCTGSGHYNTRHGYTGHGVHQLDLFQASGCHGAGPCHQQHVYLEPRSEIGTHRDGSVRIATTNLIEVRLGLGTRQDGSVRKATTDLIEVLLGLEAAIDTELLKYMSKTSAIDNNRPNRMADALPFADFRVLVTYGWDSARPVDEGFWTLIKYLVMKFMVLTVLVFANLQRICYGVRLGLGPRRDEPVRKATTDLIEARLGVGRTLAVPARRHADRTIRAVAGGGSQRHPAPELDEMGPFAKLQRI
jgi:hypothetical protein